MKKQFVAILFLFALGLQAQPAPKDLTFLFGSCARWVPGKQTAEDKKFRIFETMTKTPSDFMLWLGDAVYYENGEWATYAAMRRKNAMQREALPQLQAFLDSRSRYAIWDDHDFGENNAHSNNPMRDSALMVFKEFWNNPAYGNDTLKGVFFKMTHEDADFFMLDGRYYSDISKGEMLGRGQLEWLKYELKASKARFKFLVSGSQFFTYDKIGDSYRKFPKEYAEFMAFLQQERIEGIIILSGDRHESELSKFPRPDAYPLYDFTCSPLTSFVIPVKLKNPYRVKGTQYIDRNFGRVILSGTPENRTCNFTVFSRDGKEIWTYTINANDLRYR